ncbi:MAG TPA: class I SAM-dependent methyltransferase [Planctomycetota bacterium]
MEFERLRRNWENLGRTDPMWAILTDPSKAGGKWDDAAFFKTGEDDIAWLGSWLGLHGIDVPKGEALDFGCGIGRLTQALAPHFTTVTGVDVSAPMIELAIRKNRHAERVRYVCNPRPDLAAFADGSFAFVASIIVLQHMRKDYALGYLREFLRVLRPGGLLFFQIPTAELKAQPSPLAPAVEQAGETHMEMHVTPRTEVLATIAAGGGVVLRDEEDRWAGPHWQSYHFAVGRR